MIGSNIFLPIVCWHHVEDFRQILLENKELILANNENRSRAITKDELDTLQRGVLLSDLPGTQTELDLISNNLK